jgi:hypothetical protein
VQATSTHIFRLRIKKAPYCNWQGVSLPVPFRFIINSFFKQKISGMGNSDIYLSNILNEEVSITGAVHLTVY